MTGDVRRVLLVEDDEANAALQRKALERAGFQVVVSHTAERAMAALSDSAADILVVDHQLRGESTGIAFCATLHAAGIRIPIVMVSASNDERIVVDALRVGVKDFVLKDEHFFQELPFAVARVFERTEVEAQVSAARPLKPAVSSVSILIVEDDEAQSKLESKALNRAGYSVVVAATLEAVLRAVQTSTIELVVLDQRLANGETGLNIYNSLQAAGYDIPAILVTGFSDRETAAEALRAGVREYVEKKPGFERQLSTVVQRVLERANLERELMESRTRLASIISSARDAIVTSNTSGQITLMNHAAARLFGAPANATLGKGISDFLPGLRLANSHSSRSGVHLDPFEMEGRKQDGSVCPLEVSVSSDEIAGERFYTIIARDISARKQAEADLRATNEALARANDDLQQFAYISSHDLQEPIRTVTSYTQMLERHLAGKLDEDGRTYMGYVVSSARRISALVADALQYALLSSNAPNVTEVSTEDTLRDVLYECDALIRQTGATVTHDSLPRVRAQRAQLEVVFRNLITNAIKYRSDEPPRIRVSAKARDGIWEFSVSDNGIGFDSQYSDQIFRVFKRLHGQDIPGTGIGLALCKRILENHGGAIWAKSTPGRGSTFYFTLPNGQEQRLPATARH